MCTFPHAIDAEWGTGIFLGGGVESVQYSFGTYRHLQGNSVAANVGLLEPSDINIPVSYCVLTLTRLCTPVKTEKNI